MNQTEDDIEAELAEFLGETTVSGSQDVDWRANVPQGTVLAETSVQGAAFQWTKQGSGVRAGKVPLPERTMVWDTRTGVTSMVPTAQLRYQLGKRRADGSRVYSRRKPEGIEEPTPIADTCQICFRSRKLAGAANPHRNFFSEDQLQAHYLAFHTNEWNAMERDRDIKERREQGDRMEKLIATLTLALLPNAANKLPEDVQEQIAAMQKQIAELSKVEPPAKGKS